MPTPTLSVSAGTHKLVDGWVTKSRQAVNAGQYLKAEQMARQALTLLPDAGEIHAFGAEQALGEALLRQGKNQEALNTFTDLAKHNPQPYVLCRVGLLLARLGRIEESRTLWNTKFETTWFGEDQQQDQFLPATDNQALLEGSWLLQTEDQERTDDAIALYYAQKAVQLIPKNPILQLVLGDKYLESKKYAQAVAALKIAAKRGVGVCKSKATGDLRMAEWLLNYPEYERGHPPINTKVN